MAMIDRTGQRFGDLVVVGLSHKEFRSKRHGYYNFWKCICDCGNETIVLSNNLIRGNTKSCGCKSSRLTIKERVTTHGKVNTSTYTSWRAMKDRCYCKSHVEYKRYGAIGITVCDRWKDSFENFLADMGERPEKHSIERLDPNKGYSPENCVWADKFQQANNRKNNVFLSYDGKTMTATMWARHIGISNSTIYARLKRNWTIEKTLKEYYE